jgi:2-polyprenyl-3-methyl-5-hydroxy-6-metoxy-1,4-benzoquinol methylase
MYRNIADPLSGKKSMKKKRKPTTFDAGHFGRHWSYNLNDDPKRLAFVLARYRFAAQMACSGKKVLELGCSEGIGATLLVEFATKYTGVDMDGSAVFSAKANFSGPECRFIEDDFLDKKYGHFDAVISMDVIEHIHKKFEAQFFNTVRKNLGKDGVCIIGTPNVASERYASPTSRLGHVNLYSADRLEESLRTLFHNVFIFSMNDEMVHTGFAPMAHFLIGVGCYLKTRGVSR